MDLRESVSATTPSEVVQFDKLTPTTSGVVFDPNTPATSDVLYVSTVNASTWIYNGSSYITYTAATLPNTPFYLLGTTIDAGGNKTAAIEHSGPLRATTFTGFGLGITGLNATNLAAGIVNVGRLGTGAVGSGDKYLADNNTWKTISSGGKIGIPNATTGIFSWYSTLEAARDAAVSGDTIFVYPGSYTVTTTATNGLSKSGVHYDFAPGAIATKTTNGWMFSLSGLASASNVYGKGAFYKTGGTQGIHWAGDDGTAIALDFTFEADYVQQSVVAVTFSLCNNVSNLATYNVRHAIASGSHLLYIASQSNVLVNTHTFRCTAGSAIRFNSGSTYITVNASLLQSTTADAVGAMYQIINGTFNVGRAVGSVYGYGTNGGAVDITVTGYASGIAMTSGGNFNHNGTTAYLYNTGGNFKGGTVGYATINGGTVSYKADSGTNANHTITGGFANIELPYHGYSFALNATGGKTILWGNGSNVFTLGARIIAGGTVVFNGDLEYGGTDYLGNRDVFTLNSGKLVINGRIKNLLTAQSTGTCVTYNGGTLVCNGAVLLTSNVDVPPIIVGGANRDIKVLTGGLNTNRITGLTSAKKAKRKYIVDSVVSTSVSLNDGTGLSETFTESNVATYNTRQLLAQRMAALINASGTLDLTASQDTPGTDLYFYIESDIAGTPFTNNSLINLTGSIIRENSYALTNITGGTIIEDADVE